MSILSRLFESKEARQKRMEAERLVEEAEAKRGAELYIRARRARIWSAINDECDSTTREAAEEFLRSQSRDDVLPVIREMLSSPRKSYYGSQVYISRWNALSCLGFLGHVLGWEETVDLLKPFVGDTDEHSSYCAVQSLSDISGNEVLRPRVAEAANEVFDPLFRYFVGTTDLNVLPSLQELISLTGERRIQPLLSALPSLKDEYQRKYALKMLSHPAAVKALTDMLEPAGARSSHQAALALSRIPGWKPDPEVHAKMRRARINISEGPDHFSPWWYYYLVNQKMGEVHAKTVAEVTSSGGPGTVFDRSPYVHKWWRIDTVDDFEQMIDDVSDLCSTQFPAQQ